MKDPYAAERAEMVRTQLEARDITDPRVLDAMARVPRHLFVPDHMVERAYEDGPLPIGEGQTISQPYIVALLAQLSVGPGARRALDVGTGCGYQAAVLSLLVEEVWSIEIVPSLGEAAAERLRALGHANVHVRVGSGRAGWPEAAPFDAIVAACATAEIPEPLIEQLAPGGALVLPVGDFGLQRLVRVRKDAQGRLAREDLTPVAFVPMVDTA